MTLLSELNERQREAVEHANGPLLIIAGAGSGKTKTIAHRIAHLIASGIPAYQILAVTFTNKAAGEMKERVLDLLKREKIMISHGKEPFMGTFHSLGVHILRAHGSLIGIPRSFSILDEEDTRQVDRKSVV